MRCCYCLRNVAAGVEAQKMVVEYQQSDGTTKVFGYMMADGPISSATGQMVKGYHHKCWWVSKKREARGDSVTGRVVTGGPTGYDINEMALSKDDLDVLGITHEEALKRGTITLSARLTRLRELAEAMGKGVGDAQVQEAYAAQVLHAGPYAHHHDHRLETYQLLAHLHYAHGVPEAEIVRPGSHPQDQHLTLHAHAALDELVQLRQEDGDIEPPERDWRDQHVVDM